MKSETWIAFLRGINVGGNNLLPMKDLKKLMEALGCTDIQTYIQSGNAVFKTNQGKPPDTIGAAIEKKFGFRPHVLVMSVDALKKVFKTNPYEGEGKTIHFFMLDQKPSQPDLKKLTELAAADERFQLTDTVFYLHTPSGLGNSKLATKVEKCLGVPATARNLNTITKLLELST